jgi:dTDP-4-dehydrorhamnose 3,5-epimerase
MRFQETKIPGLFLIELDRREDHRGFFARSWCRQEFLQHGLNAGVVQINVGYTAKRGGLRGMHFQAPPNAEAKTARCTRGAIFDVGVDLRPESPTFKQWFGAELTAENHRMLHIPEGCAHGYQTLADDTEMEYLTTANYSPQDASGVRFDDPEFAVLWPLPVSSISDADRSWPDFQTQLRNVILPRSQSK